MTNTIAQISASLDNGGCEASGIVYNDANSLDFYRGIKAWYLLHTQNGWSNIAPAFFGHLEPDAWDKEFLGSSAPWSGYTAQEFLKNGDLQGIFFKSEPFPTNSHQIIDMKFSDIVYHVLREHCNLVPSDINPDGILQLNIDDANSASVSSYEIKDGNMWQKLQEIAKLEFYVIYVDKTNTLNYIPHPQFSGLIPDFVFTLDNEWLLEPLTFEKRNIEAIGQIILHGTQPDGTQLTGTYPTDPEPGPIIKKSGYLIDNSSDLTVIAERMYKSETSQYIVTARIGNAVGLLIELLDRIAITYSSEVDGINWIQKAFYITDIRVSISDNFTATTELILEEENA